MESFNEQDFFDAVDTLVPKFQIEKIKSVLKNNTLNEDQLESFGLTLTGEKKEFGATFLTGAPNPSTASIWKAINAEIYNYLCTSSKKYEKERNGANVTAKGLIATLALAVANSFNIATGVIAGAVTIAVFTVFKIGKNAWCSTHDPKASKA
ncbi:hypothetical protein HWE02_00825 [Pseudomonas oryzihabitans]|uniref:hypothetical protein n=1 Tax=Pseudomonas oryzihabitans TaxID=47885 RepID=UPI001F517840|nr:hypothetical protein [Pseudomonas oryzihabitans]MCI1007793.1 hypothetical protein [Pseudomonas oryzihabitans]